LKLPDVLELLSGDDQPPTCNRQQSPDNDNPDRQGVRWSCPSLGQFRWFRRRRFKKLRQPLGAVSAISQRDKAQAATFLGMAVDAFERFGSYGDLTSHIIHKTGPITLGPVLIAYFCGSRPPLLNH
jgi:hypothetical protein